MKKMLSGKSQIKEYENIVKNSIGLIDKTNVHFIRVALENIQAEISKFEDPQPPKSKKTPKKPSNATLTFETFWEAYPRKQAKAIALKAFIKINPDEFLLETIMGALNNQKKSNAWIEGGIKFIPHPATWLNGQRWNDEVAETAIASVPSDLIEDMFFKKMMEG